MMNKMPSSNTKLKMQKKKHQTKCQHFIDREER